MATDDVHFRHCLFLPAARPIRRETWLPPADVYRVPGGWLVKLELAGVHPEDVHLTVRSNTLLVQGTRRDETLHAGLDCYRMEIAYSRFERILELTGISDVDDVRASYRQGMLLVRIVTEGLP